jgi:predicted nicotinamide N-methyase
VGRRNRPARYVLDHPDQVAGRSVLDLAAGSGIGAIAVLHAGAAARRRSRHRWRSSSTQPQRRASRRALRRILDLGLTDLGLEGDVLVIAGDVFYSQQMSKRVLTFLRRAAREGAGVLVGEPGRAYFPTD